MSYTKEEVLEYIQANDVKFVRLVFCDLHGTPKNVAIMAEYLPQVFEAGAAFDASILNGSSHHKPQSLFLRPDPFTFAVLPWRPQSGRAARMYCDIVDQSNEPYPGDGRGLLRELTQKTRDKGLFIKTDCECGFYLFEMDDEGLPTLTPHDRAGYLDIAPLDRCENVRRDICLSLEELGSAPLGSYHERGPGQNSIWRRPIDVLSCTDDLVTYKTVVRTIAVQHGLFATFMPTPSPGLHTSSLSLNLSLEDAPGSMREVSEKALSAFMGGVARRVAEISLFLWPSTNAYTSLAHTCVSDHLSWQGGRLSRTVHIPSDDNRAPYVGLDGIDPLCNPYYVLSLLLAAGLEGMETGASLNTVLSYTPREDLLLPQDLNQALERAQNSNFINETLPPDMLRHLFAQKKDEWRSYCSSEDKVSFEQQQYFAQI